MAGKTPYHSFNTYDKLESWDYNPDFDKLDARLELRGSLADRPSSAPDGAKYIVDDPADAEHGTVYIYDGGTDTWNAQPVQSPAVYGDETNNTVYASENVTELPSISEGVNALTNDTKQELVIVGGVNEITSTITVPAFGSGVGETQAVSIKTAGDSVIKQADGADLSQIVDIDGPVAHLDVSIDGNKANNTTAVEGVRCRDVNSHAEVVARVFACDTGVNIEGNTESAKFDVYSERCGVGVEEQQNANGDTPDENEITIRGHANDGPYYKKVSAGILSSVHLNVENSKTTGEPNVDLADGKTTLSGISRGGDNSNIMIRGSATVVCNGLTASVAKSNDNILQQSTGDVMVTNCVINQAARHNINATSSVTAYNNIITNAGSSGIRLTGDNHKIGANVYSGNTNNDFVNDGSGDYSRIDLSTFGAGGNVILDATGSYRIHANGSEEYRFGSSEMRLNNSRLRDPANNTTNDGMTANPETDTEDGYLEVNIAGTIYQIPIYQA